MKKAGSIIKTALLGAIGFWLPDSIWHIVSGGDFSVYNLIGLTILLPLAFFITYRILNRRSEKALTRFKSWPMIIGIWSLGDLFMMTNWSFYGGGFANWHGQLKGILYVLPPISIPFTFMMSIYDESLGALVLVSVAAFVFFIQETFGPTVTSSGMERDRLSVGATQTLQVVLQFLTFNLAG